MGIKLTIRLEKNINRKDEKITNFSINRSFFIPKFEPYK